MRACAVLLITLVAVAASSAAVAPSTANRSIRGVALGMTRAQVTKALPDAGHDRGSSSQRGAHTENWNYKEERLLVSFSSKQSLAAARVTSVSTEANGDRFRGAGVGSTLAEIRRAIPGLTCDKPTPRLDFKCRNHRERVGVRLTYVDVLVKTRRVRLITICRIVTIAQGVPLCYPLAS